MCAHVFGSLSCRRQARVRRHPEGHHVFRWIAPPGRSIASPQHRDWWSSVRFRSAAGELWLLAGADA